MPTADLIAAVHDIDPAEASAAAAEVNAVLDRYPALGVTGALVVLGSGMLARVRLSGLPDHDAHVVLVMLGRASPRRTLQ